MGCCVFCCVMGCVALCVMGRRNQCCAWAALAFNGGWLTIPLSSRYVTSRWCERGEFTIPASHIAQQHQPTITINTTACRPCAHNPNAWRPGWHCRKPPRGRQQARPPQHKFCSQQHKLSVRPQQRQQQTGGEVMHAVAEADDAAVCATLNHPSTDHVVVTSCACPLAYIQRNHLPLQTAKPTTHVL